MVTYIQYGKDMNGVRNERKVLFKKEENAPQSKHFFRLALLLVSKNNFTLFKIWIY